MSIFLIGIIVSYIQENLHHKDHSVLILSHWFVFCWLLIDIHVIARTKKPKPSVSLFNAALVPLIYYIILVFMFWRVMLLILYLREKGLSTFRSRRVYSLIDPPPTVF